MRRRRAGRAAPIDQGQRVAEALELCWTAPSSGPPVIGDLLVAEVRHTRDQRGMPVGKRLLNGFVLRLEGAENAVRMVFHHVIVDFGSFGPSLGARFDIHIRHFGTSLEVGEPTFPWGPAASISDRRVSDNRGLSDVFTDRIETRLSGPLDRWKGPPGLRAHMFTR